MQPLSRPYNSGQYNNYYDEEEDSIMTRLMQDPRNEMGLAVHWCAWELDVVDAVAV